MSTIRVRLFGAFRKYIPSGVISITIDRPCGTTEIKSKILQQIKSENANFCDDLLIAESALANEKEILFEDAMVDNSAQLALLPPVCGG